MDDRHHCVISDFGQSEMKTEVYRISGLPLPRASLSLYCLGLPHQRLVITDGTLRWQAPELMGGHSGLTQQVDVYAFAITCVELLTKGKLPWPMADDDAVRYFVLRKAICCQLSEHSTDFTSACR